MWYTGGLQDGGETVGRYEESVVFSIRDSVVNRLSSDETGRLVYTETKGRGEPRSSFTVLCPRFLFCPWTRTSRAVLGRRDGVGDPEDHGDPGLSFLSGVSVTLGGGSKIDRTV